MATLVWPGARGLHPAAPAQFRSLTAPAAARHRRQRKGQAARSQAPTAGAGAGAAYPEEEPGVFASFQSSAAQQPGDVLSPEGGSGGGGSTAGAAAGPASGFIATVKAACAAYDRAVKANPVLTKVSQIDRAAGCWPAVWCSCSSLQQLACITRAITEDSSLRAGAD